jgi:hypothetical protein
LQVDIKFDGAMPPNLRWFHFLFSVRLIEEEVLREKALGDKNGQILQRRTVVSYSRFGGWVLHEAGWKKIQNKQAIEKG